jgi:hypothetical protein
MMAEYISNRLHFATNRKTILAYLRSKPSLEDGPVEFSLNAIRLRPAALLPASDGRILSLSRLNVDGPELDADTRDNALSKGIFDLGGKRSNAVIQAAIDATRKTIESIENGEEHTRAQGTFDRALAAYEQLGFFSGHDWGLTYWGTPEDIHSAVPSTFVPTTTCIEFTTAWTPPLAALQVLANTFPSVKFKLQYRRRPETGWTEVQFYPFPPFGY